MKKTVEKNKLLQLIFFIHLLIENSRSNWNLKINFTNNVSLYDYSRKNMTTENKRNKLLIVNLFHCNGPYRMKKKKSKKSFPTFLDPMYVDTSSKRYNIYLMSCNTYRSVGWSDLDFVVQKTPRSYFLATRFQAGSIRIEWGGVAGSPPFFILLDTDTFSYIYIQCLFHLLGAEVTYSM